MQSPGVHQVRYLVPDSAPLLDRLAAWLYNAFGLPDPPDLSSLWQTDEGGSPTGELQLLSLLDKNGNPPNLLPAEPPRGDRSLVLCLTEAIQPRDKSTRLHPVLIWPPGSFPAPDAGDGSPVWRSASVSLCLRAGDPTEFGLGSLMSLSDILACGCKSGATGMSLSWPGQDTIPLDVYTPRLMHYGLEAWGLLPAFPSARPPAKGTWSADLTWLGLLPASFPHDAQVLLKDMPPKERRDLLLRVMRNAN